MKKLILLLFIIPIIGFSQKILVLKAARIPDNSQFQGLSWNQSTDSYTRLGTVAGLALAVTPGNAYLPIQSKMKGCLLLDNGAVNYYLEAGNWNYKEDGTASTLTGADGQVMVQIPKFYYKYVGASNLHQWRISLYPLSGYTVHPAFIKDGVEVNYRYIGAYEAVLYDASGADYVEGHNVSATPTSATTDSVVDKLSSVSGKYPITFHTRAGFRKMASNRGSGWRQMDFDLYSAVQLLYLIEYGSFYSQSVLSAGITNCAATWEAYNNYYPIAKTGNGNGIGNASGANAAAVGSVCADVFSSGFLKYRGIENPYGSIWKFIDGININSGLVYISNTSSSWADGTGTNYTNTGITNSTTSEYQTTLNYYSRGFLPATVGSPGTSSAYITDYCWYASGWRGVVAGGGASHGSLAGFFALSGGTGSGVSDRDVGARAAY